MPSASARSISVRALLVEHEHRDPLAARGRGGRVLRRDRRLAGAGRPHDQRARAAVEPAAEQRVELGEPARERLARRTSSWCSAATRRGKTASPPVLDREVVVAAAELRAAQLRDAQPPAVAAVHRRQLLERDHAVREALQLQVARLGRAVVEQQHGAAAAVKYCLRPGSARR